jgi:putative ABC transport system ATP-binding protein
VDVRAFRRQHLGFVFQKANLIPFLNAVENVAVALEINDTPPARRAKRAMELLDYLGVADRANNLPDALSGGQQQRVAVARALANQPSLILADEPTAALDSHRGRQVMELFRKVAHERGSPSSWSRTTSVPSMSSTGLTRWRTAPESFIP